MSFATTHIHDYFDQVSIKTLEKETGLKRGAFFAWSDKPAQWRRQNAAQMDEYIGSYASTAEPVACLYTSYDPTKSRQKWPLIKN